MKGVYTEKITDISHISLLKTVLATINPELASTTNIERFREEEVNIDRTYNVYKVESGTQTYILKKSNDLEIGVYENFLAGKTLPVPALIGWTCIGEDKWILIEYIFGTDLRRFDEAKAYGCADSLCRIFNMYWQEDCLDESRLDNRFDRYWARINKRAECLKDEVELSSAYRIFGDRQLVCPRTLCNGDLLQCNAIEGERGIVLIDWGFSGIMPYSLDIARLISHGSESCFPFPFYMNDEYRGFFLRAVYDRLLHKPDYRQFVWDVTLARLNEYIEFIEAELRNEAMERDAAFDYYYENARLLADVILRGKDHLDI